MQELQKKGFQRVKIDGEIYEFDSLPNLDKKKKHNIEVVVDRIVLSDDIGNRLADSVETALNLSDGLVIIEDVNEKSEKPNQDLFSSKFACPVSGFTIDEIEPRLFSFNNPFGACAECDGIGTDLSIDPNLVVPNKNLSINEDALAPWPVSKYGYFRNILETVSKKYKFSLNTPWKNLGKKIQNIVLYGTGDTELTFTYDDGYEYERSFEGVINNLERRFLETESDWMRGRIERYQGEVTVSYTHLTLPTNREV